MPAKLTTQEFINKARLKHGDKFSYDKVNYVNSETKVIITCRVHGDFLQKPGNHLFGACCLRCRQERTGKANSMSQEEFVTKSQGIHGRRYDYSKVIYRGCFNPIEIICPKHGSFHQKPSIHLTNHGCPRCGKEQAGNLTRRTTEEFIKEAIKIHGKKYDYSLVEYKGSHKTVKIICPVHGIFSQRPCSHLAQRGCTKCWLEYWANSLKIDTGIFIERAVKKHGNKYDYSLVEYIDNKVPVKIFCPTHGQFEQIPNSHLRGSGCYDCGYEKLARKFSSTSEEFIKRCKKVHNDRYTYDLVEYKNGRGIVKIICPTHGEFSQVADKHLQGQGCPTCNFSYGQRQVGIVLEKLGIVFESEKKFCNCQDIKLLPFDFYFSINDIHFLIEFDGRQHYESIAFFGGVDGYKLTQHHDAIKTQFALDNGFILIRIPYTEFNNIETIIKQVISS